MSEFMDEMMSDPMYAAWNDDYTEPDCIDYDSDYYSLRDEFSDPY